MKNKKLFYLFLSISVLIFVVIMWLSLTGGKQSSNQSSQFGNVVGELLPPTSNGQGGISKPIKTDPKFQFFIRKAFGHFGLFFGFAFFVNLTFLQTKLKYYISGIGSFLIGVGTASLSELMQFIPEGRGASIKDVLIDSSGYLACVIIFAIYLFFIYKYNKKRIDDNKEESHV